MKTAFGILLAAILLTLCPGLVGYPEPAVVQKVDQWTLKTVYSQPEQILLKMPGEQSPRRFWYIILNVTNDSSQEAVEFFPVCQLITDTFQVIPADKSVSRSVFEIVKKKHQGSYPFLESLDFKDHRIFQGKDNMRTFAIIWPDFDPKAKQVSLFAGGLSNETAVLEHPKLKDEDGKAKKIFLQKTLQLKYAVAGDEKLRDTTTMKEIEKDWVMR
ncbi:MAG: hypothetical protein ABFR90_09260 [Planctomycetota bacterium]